MSRANLIGREHAPYAFPIEWGKVREFAAAILASDPMRFTSDEAATRGLRGVLAPSTFSAVSSHWMPTDPTGALLVLDRRRVLAAGDVWEYLHPVVAGDCLTVIGAVTGVEHKTRSLRRNDALHPGAPVRQPGGPARIGRPEPDLRARCRTGRSAGRAGRGPRPLVHQRMARPGRPAALRGSLCRPGLAGRDLGDPRACPLPPRGQMHRVPRLRPTVHATAGDLERLVLRRAATASYPITTSGATS